jgi:hypothetical protein
LADKAGRKKNKGYEHKRAVLSLVERGGEVRSFHVDRATIIKLGREFASHGTVNHALDEYVNGDAYTNTVEGYFSIFKRGFKGVHQHCGENHLHRYLAEYDFRYNNRIAFGIDDARRTDIALLGIGGKRLTYRRING